MKIDTMQANMIKYKLYALKAAAGPMHQVWAKLEDVY